MLRISWQTLRARRATLAGAFVAIFLAVTLAYATGLLMAGALSAPGPGRLAAADAVVRADPTVTIGHGDDADRSTSSRRPRLPAAAVARAAAVPGVARAVGDVDVRRRRVRRPRTPVRRGGAERLRGHGWDSAALTPVPAARRARARRPARRRRRRAPRRARRAARPDRHARRARRPTGSPASPTAAPTAIAARRRCSSPRARPQALSGTPGRVNAIGVVAAARHVAERAAHAAARALGRRRRRARPRPRRRRRRRRPAGHRPRRPGRHLRRRWAASPAPSRCSSWPARSRSRSPSAGARPPCCARSGATPRQVRRLIAAEALIVSLVGGRARPAGRPAARARASSASLVDHGVAPHGFEPGHSWIPLAAALGRRHRHRAARGRRRRAPRRPRTPERGAARGRDRARASRAWSRTLTGVLCLGGGVAMAIVFSGEAALAFSIIGGILLATGTALLGRWLLGLPAAALSLPLRLLGAAGPAREHEPGGQPLAHRGAGDADRPDRDARRHAGASCRRARRQHVERVTAARVTADHVVVGRDGAPLPAGTASRLARLPGVDAAAGMLPTSVFLLDKGLGWDTPWAAAGVAVADTTRALDLRVTSGSLGDVRGIGGRGEQRRRDRGPSEGRRRRSRADGGHPGCDAARRRDLRPLGRARRRRARRRCRPTPREHPRRRCRVRRRRARGCVARSPATPTRIRASRR